MTQERDEHHAMSDPSNRLTCGQETHGSLVARKYGIPAVVAVADATTLLGKAAAMRLLYCVVDGSDELLGVL